MEQDTNACSSAISAALQGNRSADGDGASSSQADRAVLDKRQKRNKPSLSCEACTVKKTKCDRERPTCLACLKRRSGCHYSELANRIEESHRALGIDTPRKRVKTAADPPAPSLIVQHGSRSIEMSASTSSTGSSPSLLSNVPFSHPTASNIFKAEHPFSNYWTLQGGLAEVVGVMPRKEQADILIARYFDAVDPVYPMIHRQIFLREYDNFWTSGLPEGNRVDGAFLALIFVMLAMGTQFVNVTSAEKKEETAEFYVSASHQALRMSSYLSRPSMRSIQAMVLMTYFLMNDNHASDAWAFAGILNRQAYALGLNRDPSFIVPHATAFEKQQRRKLWQAVLLQDTFFTVLLKLPPTAMHTDVKVDDLLPDLEDVDGTGAVPHEASDISFIRSMWTLANLVQQTICPQRSLDLPICTSPKQRTNLISSFHQIFASFPAPFQTFTEPFICELASQNKRSARQILFLASNYFHCLMLVCADEHQNIGVDVEGTLQAAHSAMNSFFLLHDLFEDEARVWYHFQNRAFSEALIAAELFKNKPDGTASKAMYVMARMDLMRMIRILQSNSRQEDVVAKTRVGVLSTYL